MSEEKKKLVYRAFGMTLSSDLHFPELPVIDDRSLPIDVEIEMSDLTACPERGRIPDHQFALMGGTLYVHIPGTALYGVQDGRKITAYAYPEADHNRLRLYLLGSCMGAVLLHRHILPLHGSAVVVEGKAFAFIGDSGAGKSTLAAAFLKRGYRLISDDVIAVVLADDRKPMIIPAYPQQKLWQESLERFDMEPARYRPLISNANKYAVSVHSQFQAEPVPLAGAIELVKSAEDIPLSMTPLNRLEGLHSLLYHTYRRPLAELLGKQQWHFSTAASVAANIELWQIQRPAERFTAHIIADYVLNNGWKEVLTGTL